MTKPAQEEERINAQGLREWKWEEVVRNRKGLQGLGGLIHKRCQSKAVLRNRREGDAL